MFDVEAGSYMILFGADTLKNKRKGFDLLLEALKKIPESIGGRNVVPVVFGPSCGNDVRESAALRHVGYITDQQLLSHLYSAADVMVTPSRKEAFGLTCLEALSCGTPVVAFKTGGYLDQIKHMDNGWLAEEESVDSLREGISSVLLDEGLRIRMGEQALRTVRSRFTIEREVNGYESLYSELVEGL
ncbi:MAG: glycosyltransferase [Verrucomicrobiota bacterium]